MSLADTARREAPADLAPARHRGATARLVRSELGLVLGRRRNVVLLAGLGLVPLLLGVVVSLARDAGLEGQGPPFLSDVTGNGLFLVVVSLFLCTPFLLPLTIGIASGDAIAGEASAGTLRYLLTVPVGRGRLLAVKALGALTFAAAAVLAVAVVGLVTGAVLFGVGDLTLLSGDTVPLADGVLRVAGVVLYVGLSMTGLVAVGLFFSTLTEVPVGAMAATVVVAVVSSVLVQLPQLAAIHPLLLTYHWFDFAEMLRVVPSVHQLAQGLAVQAGWVAVFGSLAWARFTTADVTS
ncbi:putative ABC transporter integral membrane protein [Cellulomonas flavigena DSM 20109]|uniref:Putative ABC transporter integral membrane protein n=1 Tax=Cellulomonas flavigena (strain ATCC 482 / DSM 20109 / BCRC 11376 / JCM 18109 / NBRC 3775 / NCIMB 8073 / NRS 134) TaxID=446466 RepID=D5UBU6_CELFN|nr:ABC transporter permease [Cellulomonas flavigena]ADG74191.1 putative ABC transporter integral membrane protein [Cellulomonas flavigena DSM 20109]